MNLFIEWSTRRKRRVATPAPDPVPQESLDHTAVQAGTVPIGTIGTNGTAHGALVADLKTLFGDDGPASEAAAERLAKARMVADVPAGDDRPAWQAWMNRRYVWRRGRYSRAEALGIVWGEAECEWHRRHGAAPDPDRCAGCGERLPSGAGMRQIDGAVVHVGDPEQVECLAAYGAQWRGAASVGLMALGLMRPRP
jgi:hypothetical protein